MFKSSSKLVLVILALLFGGESFAQTVTILKKADGELNAKDWYYALEDYLKVYDKKPNDPLVIEKILICNKALRNYTDVLTWTEQLVRLNSANADYQYEYASALQNLGKYKEAKVAYTAYLKMVPADRKRVDPLIRSCDTAIKWTAKPQGNIKIQNVTALNTAYSDWGLTHFGGGFMFSSDRRNEEASMILASGAKNGGQDVFGGTGRPYLKLYYVNYNADSTWSKPAFFSKLITEKYHTSSASFDEGANILYFSRTRKIDIPKSFNKSTFRVELVYSEAFREIKPFPYNSILNYSVGDPCVSLKGKRLYFASDMPGGYGGSDLYYCDLKSDGTWGSPQNLGPEVNSPGQERYPTLVGDTVLYFSSDGHVGMGGLDIYSSQRNKKGLWSSVANVGPPINSAQDDFSVLITNFGKGANGQDHFEGYFSSDRPGGKGSDDIYAFQSVGAQEVHPLGTIAVQLVDHETGQGLANSISKVKPANGPGASTTVKANDVGIIKYPGKVGQTVVITTKKPGSYTTKTTFTPKPEDVDEPDDDTPIIAKPNKLVHKPAPLAIVSKPIVKGQPERLGNIYYKFNQWNINSQAAEVLDSLVEKLSDNPEIVIELSSHTDTRGDAAINKYISQMRAQSAVNYLISKGVDRTRVFAKGYGKEQPVVKCGGNCTEADHAQNRRTEFKVVRIIDEQKTELTQK